jgi:hypothetical protein
MREEKHLEALAEVKETIETAIRDPRGIIVHQRRLMSMISLGVQHLIELHFHRLNVLKSGAQVKHDWFRLSKERVKLRLKAVTTKPLQEIEDVDFIIILASEMEADRNELVYGAPAPEAKLRRKIDLFLQLEELMAK